MSEVTLGLWFGVERVAPRERLPLEAKNAYYIMIRIS